MKHVHMLPPQEEPPYRVRIRERQKAWAWLEQQNMLVEAVRRHDEMMLKEQAIIKSGLGLHFATAGRA